MEVTKQSFSYSHPHPAVAVDLAIFTVAAGELQLLLVQRGVEPFKGRWALPGGFVRIDEDLGAAAARELREETGIEDAYLEQVGAFGKPGRDPRERVISIAYFAILANGPAGAVRSGSDAADARWWAASELPKLAFDHASIVSAARRCIAEKAHHTDVASAFLGAEFTLTELQQVHEALVGQEVDKRNFRKWASGVKSIRSTGRMRRGGAHRPALLYRVHQT